MRNGTVGVVRIVSGREFQGRWVVAIEGIDTMNEAETLRGLDLRVPVDALHPLEPGTHYVHDLEGCAVETVSGEAVGRVTGVQFGSATPLLMVASAGGEVLIPLVEGICRLVDPAAKRIVIDPPDGLIEVNRAGAMKG
jgi:16S rRNA processing protein RimM